MSACVFYTQLHISQTSYSITCSQQPQDRHCYDVHFTDGEIEVRHLPEVRQWWQGWGSAPALSDHCDASRGSSGLRCPWAGSQLSLGLWGADCSSILSSETWSLWSLITVTVGSSYTLEWDVGFQGQDAGASLLLNAPGALHNARMHQHWPDAQSNSSS